MKVAIGMPAFNAALFVDQAVRSVLRELQDCEVSLVVVDDGSTDETWSILSDLAGTFSSVSISRHDNRGIAATRNAILPILIDSDFATWLDADDLMVPGRLKRDLTLLESDSSLDLVYGAFQYFEQSSSATLLPHGRTLTVRGVHLGAGLYRTRLLKEIGKFDESFTQAEDTDYLLRLFESGAKYIISEEVSYYYRRHSANLTRDIVTQRRDLARALLLSVQRRKKRGMAGLPQGIFDASALMRRVGW